METFPHLDSVSLREDLWLSEGGAGLVWALRAGSTERVCLEWLRAVLVPPVSAKGACTWPLLEVPAEFSWFLLMYYDALNLTFGF